MQVQEELLVVSKDHTQMMMIKGKRTKRQRAPSPLRLAMPYNSTSSNSSTNNSIDSATTSSPSPSPTNNTIEFREDEDMANCLILLAQGRYHVEAPTQHHNNNNNNTNNEDDNHKKSTSLYIYQCKTCNRCFPSFQALGGHRASHKKPKQNGTFSSEVVTNFIEENNDRYDPTTSTTLSLKTPNGVSNLCSTITATTTTTKANKVHECSICGAEFSSGQALGGHMRRHRTLVNASMTTSMRGGNVVGSNEFQEVKKPLKLDLNLPALPEDDHHRESKFSFQQREKNVIVFSKSSLVDCHY